MLRVQITGPRGSGKTTLVNYLRDWCKANGRTAYIHDGIAPEIINGRHSEAVSITTRTPEDVREEWARDHDPTRPRFNYHLASGEDWADDPDDPDPASVADGRFFDSSPEIRVEFEYPLKTAITRVLAHDGGFTRRDFAEAVASEYQKIYAEEEASMTDSPEPQGILLNRSRTNGVHGIWGHDLGDLVLESAQKHDNGTWELGIGS